MPLSYIWWIICLSSFLLSCADAGFSSMSAFEGKGQDAKGKDERPPHSTESQQREKREQTFESNPDFQVKNFPPGLVDGSNDSKVVAADYKSCASLPAAGKQPYGKCGDNEAVVIVNDGSTQEMTCCPLTGQIALTTDESQMHMERKGACLEDEILTGMLDSKSGTGYCTKINTDSFRLSKPVPSQYISGKLLGVMGTIAQSYNWGDTCVCPEGTVAIGGHSPQDNFCGEQCVEIEFKMRP